MFTASMVKQGNARAFDERLEYAVKNFNHGNNGAYMRIYCDDPWRWNVKEMLEERGFINVDVPDIVISGDVNSITMLTLDTQNITGDATKWKLPDALTYCALTQTAAGYGLTGDITNMLHPALLTNFSFNVGTTSNKVSGDMSAHVFPVGMTRIYFNNQNITKMPRGNYKDFDNVIGLNFTGCNCDTAEIDAFLIDMAAYFAVTTPIKTARFLIAGSGMAAPSATGAAARTSIQSAFTAAGFTATITVSA